MTLKFSYVFLPDEEVEFALTFPYNTKNFEKYYKNLKKKMKKSSKIRIQRKTLIYSSQGRPVDILWISRNDEKTEEMP